jgi:hypothetical protein
MSKIVVRHKRHGFPVHFICADRCRFRMAESLTIQFPDGSWQGIVVSSVGARIPAGREADANGELKFEPLVFPLAGETPIFFEAMVFRVNRFKECGCCVNVVGFAEPLETIRTSTGREATDTHAKLVEKYREMLEGGWFPEPYIVPEEDDQE